MRPNRICIVGLGNPGAKYHGTRHNIGFEWVHAAIECALASLGQKKSFSEKFESFWMQLEWEGRELHFLKPQTFMNESGRAVRKWVEKYQGETEILVVYDDVDLALGRLRLRFKGSDGGHRGLRSVIEHLGHKNFARLRIGIGRPSSAADTIDHVLEKFRPEEKVVLQKLLGDAGKHLKAFFQESKELAMNQINGLNYYEDAPITKDEN